MFFDKSLVKIGIITLIVPLVFSQSSVKATQGKFLHQHISNNTLLAVANQRRVALVIGNSKYQSVPELRNPANDAKDIAKTLDELNFEVILVLNADKKQMDDAVLQFKRKLSQGGVGLFYYAGHGVQVNGENYLIPINAKLNSQKDVNYQALPLGEIQNAMEEANTDANIIILDACRDNPFRSWQRGTAVNGLAPVQAIAGSYIAFATAPGKQADDGEGKNGRFTSYLLKYIKTPNLSIEELFKRVRQGVAEDTNKEQIPSDSSSLIGEFYFNSVAANATPTVAVSTPNSLPIVTTPTPTQTDATTPLPPGNPRINEISQKIEQLDQELAYADFTIEINPKDAYAYYNRGNLYYNQQKWDLAASDFTKAIEIDPKLAYAYNNRGLVYSIQQKWELAASDFTKAIEINPKLALAYNNRGNLYIDQQKWELAASDFTKAIEINPKYADAYFNRGNVYINQQKWELAASDFTKAIEINPKLADAYNNRGLIKYEQGAINEAIQQFQQAISINNEAAESQLALAVALYSQGDTEKALNLAKKALKIEPKFAKVDYLKKNLWGEKLIADAQKLLANPELQNYVNK